MLFICGPIVWLVYDRATNPSVLDETVNTLPLSYITEIIHETYCPEYMDYMQCLYV